MDEAFGTAGNFIIENRMEMIAPVLIIYKRQFIFFCALKSASDPIADCQMKILVWIYV